MDSPNLIIAECPEDHCDNTGHTLPEKEEEAQNSPNVSSVNQPSDSDASTHLEPVKKSVISSSGNAGTLKCHNCKGSFEKHHETCISIGSAMKFHQQCCVCYECKTNLSEFKHCYTKEGNIYCKEDYFKVFGATCTKCSKRIQRDDLVHRVEDKCVCCHTDLKGGQEVAFSKEGNNFLCQSDFQKLQNTMNARYQGVPNRGARLVNYMHQPLRDEYQQQQMYGTCPPVPVNMISERKSRKRKQERKPRERTVYSDTQLNKLINFYQENPRPSTQLKEKIAEELGISKKKVSVWFQNRRCKDKKKLERDERMELAKQQDEEQSRVLQEQVMHSDYPCMSPNFNYMCKPMQLKQSVIQGPGDLPQQQYMSAPMELPIEPMSCIAPIPHLIPMMPFDPIRPNLPSFSSFPFPPSFPPQAPSPLTPQPPCSPSCYSHPASTPMPAKYRNSPPEANSPVSPISEISPNEMSSSHDSWEYPPHPQSHPHIHYPAPSMDLASTQHNPTPLGLSQGAYHHSMMTTGYDPHLQPPYELTMPYPQPATPYLQPATPYEPHPCLS